MLSINEGTNAMRVYFHTKKRQRSPPEGQVPCMMSIPCMSSAESLSELESERHDGNSSGSDEDLPNRKRLCETTSLAKHRGERVNGSVGLQSHLTSKPTECEYGYRTHNGTSIKLRSTR